MFKDDDDDQGDSLENKFIDGEFDPNKDFIDDDDDDEFVDEDDEDNNPDEDDEDFVDDDEEDDDEDDDDDEDNDDEDEEGKGDDDAEGSAKGAGDDEEGSEWHIRGQHWIETGKLAAGTEIPKNVTQLELEDLYMKQVDKNIEARLQAKYSDIIEAHGIDPRKVFGEQQNFDQLALNQSKFVAGLSYDTLVEKSKDVSADLKAIGETYHLARNENLTEEEVADLVASDMKKHTEEELFDKYKAFFTEDAKRLETKIQTDAANAKKAEIEKGTKDATYIKGKLSSMEINGRKLTETEVQKTIDGMFLKNQVYDNGRGYRKAGITLLEKIRMESADSIDKQLDMAVSLILKLDPQTVKEKNEKAASLTTLQKLAEMDGSSGKGKNGGSSSKTRNKKTTNQGKILVPKNQFLPD